MLDGENLFSWRLLNKPGGWRVQPANELALEGAAPLQPPDSEMIPEKACIVSQPVKKQLDVLERLC